MMRVRALLLGVVACSHDPAPRAPPEDPYAPFVPHSEACKKAKQMAHLICTGCGPDLCWVFMKGCLRPAFCRAGEDAMNRGIDPCRYVSLQDLHDNRKCRQLGADAQLRRKSTPPSAWKPEPTEASEPHE